MKAKNITHQTAPDFIVLDYAGTVGGPERPLVSLDDSCGGVLEAKGARVGL